jgi:PilZ domain-containing protein
MTQLTVLVADPGRMPALRDGLRLDGRVLRFMSTNLATAFESIRANNPGIVAVDAAFAETAAGRAFLDRLAALAVPASSVRLVQQIEGRWATTPLGDAAPQASSATVCVPRGNTRRTPRFLVKDTVQAVVESSTASLIDLSALGAQVVSEPVLRPNQKIKVVLPDDDATLRVTAHIAWSMYERPAHGTEPYYRAGLEFTDAAQQTLEEYCRRHCGDNPRPNRSR